MTTKPVTAALTIAVVALVGVWIVSGVVEAQDGTPASKPPYPPPPVWHNTISVTSEAFVQGQRIPVEYTKDGENVSPAIAWTNIPDGTQEIVVMFEDPDGTGGNFSHWLVYGLSPAVTNLPKNVPAEETLETPNAKQGKNSLLNIGYLGPAPVPGSGVHHYTFRVFALDRELDVAAGATKEEVQQQMYQHVLAQGFLWGTYERPPKDE